MPVPSLPPLVRAVVDFATARSLFGPEAAVAVALSGGPDSCALLWALAEAAAASLLSRPVAVLHFHHGMRGVGADEDVAFCRDLAARCGIPFRAGYGTLGAGASETVARQARYAFLIDASREAGARVVATAHTADDQAETVLLRLLRGASVDGLAGIPARRTLAPGLDVVRPLLGVRRQEVLAYCAACGLAPRRDPTNDDQRFPRNRIRRLLPELADGFNPRLVEALGRLAERAREDSECLKAAAEALWERARLPSGEAGVRLAGDPLRAADPALRGRVLLRALREAAPGDEAAEERATAQWVRALEALLFGGPPSDLPGGVRAERRRGELVVWRKENRP